MPPDLCHNRFASEICWTVERTDVIKCVVVRGSVNETLQHQRFGSVNETFPSIIVVLPLGMSY